MTVRIDQFVPSFAFHDAIGNHVQQLRRLLRQAGYLSDIYYEHLDPRLAGEAFPFRQCPEGHQPGRIILYHASTHSDMNGWLIAAAAAGQPVVIDYHNITPPAFFARWEPRAASSMEMGRRQLAELASWASAGMADSEYNAAELRGFGVADCVPCPILLDLAEYHAPPDPAALHRLEQPGGATRWLFLGRVAPNKCQHDVIASFAVYRRLYEPDSRLALVGGATSARYQRSLEDMVDDLGLRGSVDFAGSAPFGELLAYFHRSSVFVCLSEHEGFCVPVIEAMELGLPVVAYSASAVTETVADAGVLLTGKDPLEVALAVHDLLRDPARREAAVAAGRDRAASFSFERTSKRWLAELSRLTTKLAAP